MAWNGVGAVTVTTPGTKVPLVAAGAPDVRCAGLFIQALSNAAHTNTGRVYIYDKNNNRLATLVAPSASLIPSVSVMVPGSPGGLSAKDYLLDADNATDGVDVSYVR